MTKEEQYRRYTELIVKWNKIAGLVSAGDVSFISKHIEDSVMIVPFVKGAKTVLDLGTGAGFPGIPIKIECPEINVTMLDSKRKKINFLKQAVLELGLSGVDVVEARAEEINFLKKRLPFDVVISRATWPLHEYLKIAMLYCDNNSRIIAMKGPKWEEELKQVNKFELIKKHFYVLKSGEKRCILVLRMTHDPPLQPRRAGS